MTEPGQGRHNIPIGHAVPRAGHPIVQPVAFDLERLVETRLLIQANSGGGKSWAIRRLLEQSHGKVQHLVIDPEGEFGTLRERYDYVLAALRGGDTAAEPRIARLLAERLLELGVSAILDIYELKHHERIQFVRGFLEALVDARKDLWHPVLVVVDEAHVFCPQNGEAESAAAVIDLCTRGRKRGFAPVLATQRIAKLHKDAAAECNNKLIGRTGLDVDVKRAADELGFGKDRWREMRDLPAGRFFGFGPALSREVIAVDVGPVQTTHPKAGSRIAAAPAPASAKVKALLPKLADLPAEAEERQKTLEDLRRELAQSRRDLAAAKKATPPAAPPAKPVEVLVLKDAQLSRLEKLVHRLAEISKATGEASLEISGPLQRVSPLKTDPHTLAKSPVRAAAPRPLASPPPPGFDREIAARAHAAKAGMIAGAAGAIPPAQQRILDALAWLESIDLTPADKNQVALLADQSPTSSGYANNLGRLRSLGLILYPSGGMVAISEIGRAIASPADAPSTEAELQRQVLHRLPLAQRRILERLVASFPAAIAKNDLASQSNQSPTSSGYANNLGRLRSLGLIDYPARGSVVAREVLFIESRP